MRFFEQAFKLAQNKVDDFLDIDTEFITPSYDNYSYLNLVKLFATNCIFEEIKERDYIKLFVINSKLNVGYLKQLLGDRVFNSKCLETIEQSLHMT